MARSANEDRFIADRYAKTHTLATLRVTSVSKTVDVIEYKVEERNPKKDGPRYDGSPCERCGDVTDHGRNEFLGDQPEKSIVTYKMPGQCRIVVEAVDEYGNPCSFDIDEGTYDRLFKPRIEALQLARDADRRA